MSFVTDARRGRLLASCAAFALGLGLAGMAHLSLVLVGGEHVGPPEQLDVRFRVGGADLFYEVLEPDH